MALLKIINCIIIIIYSISVLLFIRMNIIPQIRLLSNLSCMTQAVGRIYSLTDEQSIKTKPTGQL
jgi:hypothetical protein